MAKRFFIREAIKHPGALRSYVKRKYGRRGFTEDGAIREDVMLRLAKCPHCGKSMRECRCPATTTRRRALLALTLRRLRR
jgi:hypothetical protein